MYTPTPAATAAPLHLYDYTHGQRRLTLWRESSTEGRVYTIATVSVPVTTQAPGTAPETEWVTVAQATTRNPQLILLTDCPSDALLMLDAARFELTPDEADGIADYLGLPALPWELDA